MDFDSDRSRWSTAIVRSITFLIGGVVGCLLGGLLMGQPGYLPWGWIFFGALAAGITSATTWRRDRR